MFTEYLTPAGVLGKGPRCHHSADNWCTNHNEMKEAVSRYHSEHVRDQRKTFGPASSSVVQGTMDRVMGEYAPWASGRNPEAKTKVKRRPDLRGNTR